MRELSAINNLTVGRFLELFNEKEQEELAEVGVYYVENGKVYCDFESEGEE